MVVAYLRVSTEKQFLANQREELLRFAEKNGLKIDKWYTETVSAGLCKDCIRSWPEKGESLCKGSWKRT